MELINHNDYARISDFVFWFNNDWCMRFYVDLNKYDDKGKHNFHNEFGYTNNKTGYEILIKREFNYYLCIETSKRDSNGVKLQCKIYQNDMYFILHKLNIVEDWFIGDKNVFMKKDDKIIIPSREQFSETIRVQFSYWIRFEAAVINYKGNDVIGARVYVCNDNINFFLPAERLLSFIYVMRNFNMFLSAQNMINYIKFEYGLNHHHFEPNVNQALNNNNFFNRVKKKYDDTPKKSFFEITGARKREE